MTLNEIRQTARERMKGYCRVCPDCNGKACIGEVPGMGGLGTGSGFIANRESLMRLNLKTRLIHGVKAPDTQTELLGFNLDFPVLAAPIGGVSFNMGGQITEQDYCDAVVNGCLDCGIIGCLGDGVPPFIIDSAMNATKATNGQAIPFIKPWADEEFYSKVNRVKDAGCHVIGVDLDAVGLVTLAKMGRPVLSRTSEELALMVDNIHSMGMKFILKGVMSIEDALLAENLGCDAIVVSNHGGRVLDTALSATNVLLSISSAVSEMTILADGGIRSGVDVLKMLALGADAVLIGRPVSVAAVGGGREGVKLYFEKIKSELISAMVLTGCPSVKYADASLLA